MDQPVLFKGNTAWIGVRATFWQLIRALLAWGEALPVRLLASVTFAVYTYIALLSCVTIWRVIQWNFFDTSLIGLVLIFLFCGLVLSRCFRFFRGGHII